MIITEPVAAALAFGINKMKAGLNEMKYLLVYDFGGGTLDVTILEVYRKSCSVKTVFGNDHLGGQDFDVKIVDWAIKAWN